jgi:hypothetical protein
LAAEGKAAREVMRREKQREKAAAAALRIQRRSEAAVTKKTHQTKTRSKLKVAPKPRIRASR